MRGGAVFSLPPEGETDPLVRELAARFRVGRRRRFSETWTFHDTFDWRLHDAGWALRSRRRGRGYALRLEPAVAGPGVGAGDGERALSAVAAAPPAFGADLPDGVLGERVRALIEDRRLLPRAALRRRGESLPLLDERDKTVARLVLEERAVLCREELDPAAADGEAGPGVPLTPRLVVTPLRGYAGAAGPVAAFLETGLGLRPGEAADDLAEALAACGRRPGEYSSKVRLELDPATPAAEAMRQVHRRLFDALLANEPGVRRQLDPEFLHDFRVAVRRTRSTLGQVKGVFPDGEVAEFREGFAWLGRATGPKRDLDVFQADLARYRETLPEWAREALAPLADRLRGRAEAVQAELEAALDSDRYRRLVEGWRRFLDRPADPAAAAAAGRPVAEVASERLRKAARRVRKRAAGLDATTPAERVHRLRIECKKLRYLLEFFASLFPELEIGREVKALKRLQDVLGEYNDLAVQQAALRRHCREMGAGGEAGEPAGREPAGPETLLAAGYLLARLEDRRGRKRRELTKAVAKYLAGRGEERERRLFAPPGAGGSCGGGTAS